jgi:hypothetical protein
MNFEHEEVHSHGLGMMVGLITQLVQDLRRSNVQRHGKMGQSVEVVVGWGGETLR